MADVSTVLLDTQELEDALQQSFSAFQNTISRLVHRGRLEGALAGELSIPALTVGTYCDACFPIALNDDSYARVTHELQQRFPRTARQFTGSTHSTLLSSLATHLPDAIPASNGELIGRLNEFRRAVGLAWPVLSEIATASYASVSISNYRTAKTIPEVRP